MSCHTHWIPLAPVKEDTAGPGQRRYRWPRSKKIPLGPRTKEDTAGIPDKENTAGPGLKKIPQAPD